MERCFGNILSELRHSKDLSQRQLAGDLRISQALLSHYENGTREPGLSFVCRVCDYFGVSADYLLGRCIDKNETICASATIAEMNRFLSEINDERVTKAALSYVDNSAKKVSLYLTNHDDISLAKQAVAIAESELCVVRLMSCLSAD